MIENGCLIGGFLLLAIGGWLIHPSIAFLLTGALLVTIGFGINKNKEAEE